MDVFDQLSLDDKIQILRQEAVQVAVLDYFNFEITLFSWNSYFIEMYLETDEEEIFRISLADDKELLKFTRNICISELGFNCLS
jgi:hypothetical protein